jgi:hypothetical protein
MARRTARRRPRTDLEDRFVMCADRNERRPRGDKFSGERRTERQALLAGLAAAGLAAAEGVLAAFSAFFTRQAASCFARRAFCFRRTGGFCGVVMGRAP